MQPCPFGQVFAEQVDWRDEKPKHVCITIIVVVVVVVITGAVVVVVLSSEADITVVVVVVASGMVVVVSSTSVMHSPFSQASLALQVSTVSPAAVPLHSALDLPGLTHL